MIKTYEGLARTWRDSILKRRDVPAQRYQLQKNWMRVPFLANTGYVETNVCFPREAIIPPLPFKRSPLAAPRVSPSSLGCSYRVPLALRVPLAHPRAPLKVLPRVPPILPGVLPRALGKAHVLEFSSIISPVNSALGLPAPIGRS